MMDQFCENENKVMFNTNLIKVFDQQHQIVILCEDHIVYNKITLKNEYKVVMDYLQFIHKTLDEVVFQDIIIVKSKNNEFKWEFLILFQIINKFIILKFGFFKLF